MIKENRTVELRILSSGAITADRALGSYCSAEHEKVFVDTTEALKDLCDRVIEVEKDKTIGDRELAFLDSVFALGMWALQKKAAIQAEIIARKSEEAKKDETLEDIL